MPIAIEFVPVEEELRPIAIDPDCVACAPLPTAIAFAPEAFAGAPVLLTFTYCPDAEMPATVESSVAISAVLVAT